MVRQLSVGQIDATHGRQRTGRRNATRLVPLESQVALLELCSEQYNSCQQWLGQEVARQALQNALAGPAAALGSRGAVP